MAKERKRLRAKITVGHMPDGKPIIKYASGYSDRELEAHKTELRKKYIGGAEVQREVLYGQYVTEWYAAYKKPHLSASSRASYASIINRYILPDLGNRQMRAITATQLQMHVNSFSNMGTTVLTYIVSILQNTFRLAAAQGIIDRNPADALKRPKTEKATKRALTSDEKAATLSVIETHPDGLFLALLYYTGLRRGEVLGLRKRHIRGEILVLGYTHPAQFYLLKRYRLTQTAINHEYAMALNRYGKRMAVHVKIDTGMKRLGEPAQNIEQIMRIFECKNLRITGIYTHFSVQSDGFTQVQVDQFNHLLAELKEQGFRIPVAHAQSSCGIFARSDLRYDFARAGLALYGVYPDTGSQMQQAALRPVLSVKARVSAVKTILAGEAAGYGCAFFAPHDMQIAVLSIGYADGIPRALSCGLGHVLIHGLKASIVGYVCMDMVLVDITDIADVKQGDIAVVIGKDGDNQISACDLAEQAGTVPNEILSRLGNRLERCAR